MKPIKGNRVQRSLRAVTVANNAPFKVSGKGVILTQLNGRALGRTGALMVALGNIRAVSRKRLVTPVKPLIGSAPCLFGNGGTAVSQQAGRFGLGMSRLQQGFKAQAVGVCHVVELCHSEHLRPKCSTARWTAASSRRGAARRTRETVEREETPTPAAWGNRQRGGRRRSLPGTLRAPAKAPPRKPRQKGKAMRCGARLAPSRPPPGEAWLGRAGSGKAAARSVAATLDNCGMLG